MIFKILIIGGGLYALYRMFMPSPQIPGGKQGQQIKDQPNDDEGEYVDYEEIE